MKKTESLAVWNVTRDQLVCEDVDPAVSAWSRLRGLLCRPELQPGKALLLLPSRGIHTFCMRHTIDAVFLDAELHVVRVCSAVAPWQVRLPTRDTHCVLELRKHAAAQAGVALGNQLQFQQQDSRFGLKELTARLQSPQVSTLNSVLRLMLAVLLLVQVGLVWAARRPALEGRIDLRAYYAAGTAARLNGMGGLYSDAVEQHTQQTLFHDGWRTLHFLYPPFAVLPYRMLACLPYRSALLMVSLGSLLCLFASAFLLSRQHPRAKLSPGLLSLCALCAFPSVIALTQGQLSFLLLLLLTGFYCLERRGLHLLAGVCLAVGLVKAQIVVPIAVLYLLWRRYRVVAGFGIGAAALAVLSAATTGMASLRAYAARLHDMGLVTTRDQGAALLQYGVHTSTEPNLHGLALLLAGSGTHSAWLTLLLSFAVLAWSARQQASLATAVCAALLLSYHLLPYDLVLLLLPLALAVAQRLEYGDAGVNLGMLRRSPAAWLLAGSALLLSGPVAGLLMLHGASAWYLLASVALLLTSAPWLRRTAPREASSAQAVAVQPVALAI